MTRLFWRARFAPQHLIEFRLKRSDQIQRTWTRLDQVHVIEPKLRRLDAEGWDVYCGVNPRAALRSDGASVTELVAFHVDVDGGAAEGLRRFASKSDTAKNGIRRGPLPSSLCGDSGVERRLSSPSLPSPSAIVCSGSGVHCYWILIQPVTVSDSNREYLKGINRGLVIQTGGDPHCCDLSRVLRIPGFHNYKTHPPTEVTLLSDTGIRYAVKDLAPFAVINTPPGTVALSFASSIPPITPQLEERFKAIRRSNGEISRAWRGEIGDGSSDSRYVLVRKLTEHGFAPEEILSIVCSRRWYNRRSKQVRSADSVLRDVRGLLARTISGSGQVI